MAQYKSNIPHYTPVIVEGYEDFKDYYPSCKMQTKEWLIDNLNQDSVFIDIGANVGILTLTAGKVIGNLGQIIAIEPTSSFEILEKNLKKAENQHTTPTVKIKKAIGSRTEKRRDSLYRIWGKEHEAANWDFVTLDDLVTELQCNKIDVIKIDTDGFEMEVLKGASKVLNHFNPKVIIEINEALQTRGVTPDKVFDYFLDHRYTDVLLVDDYNYIFSNSWEIGDSWPNSLRLSRWRKNSAINLSKGEQIQTQINLSTANWNVITSTSNSSKYKGKLDKWNYIVNISASETTKTGPVVMEILGTLNCGQISAAILDTDYQTLISNEVSVVSPGKFKITLISETWKGSAIIRSFDNAQFDFEISSIALFYGDTHSNQDSRHSKVISSKIRKFKKKSDLLRQLNPHLRTDFNVQQDLHYHQGWLMEQSSNHLLVDIVKTIHEPKVLEIGTWEGFTAATLLKHTDAMIWTMDPDDVIDTAVYPSRYTNLSAETTRQIGWLFKTLPFVGRVHEIRANSNDYNWDEMENDFFDLIFIDGDHSESTVKIDTTNTFSKLKKGGICIWDDFNYEDEIVTEAESGVNNFIKNDIDWLTENFELIYLQGTQFLVGRKL